MALQQSFEAYAIATVEELILGKDKPILWSFCKG